jgi:CheY-like chemotaxis protein
LSGLFPEMAAAINKTGNQSVAVELKQRSRVLVVDDDPEFGKLLSSRLAKYGVEMLSAADAQQGLRIASRDQPSVILAAYDMPNGNAQYLMSKLRTTLETRNIPVFVLSEERLDETARQVLGREICGNPGAARILQKSIDTDELFDELQKFCGFDKT